MRNSRNDSYTASESNEAALKQPFKTALYRMHQLAAEMSRFNPDPNLNPNPNHDPITVADRLSPPGLSVSA